MGQSLSRTYEMLAQVQQSITMPETRTNSNLGADAKAPAKVVLH